MNKIAKTVYVEDHDLRLLMRLITLVTRYTALWKSAVRQNNIPMMNNFFVQKNIMLQAYFEFIKQLETKYNIKLNQELGFKFDTDDLRITYYEKI